jgi:hypothetical protein
MGAPNSDPQLLGGDLRLRSEQGPLVRGDHEQRDEPRNEKISGRRTCSRSACDPHPTSSWEVNRTQIHE